MFSPKTKIIYQHFTSLLNEDSKFLVPLLTNATMYLTYLFENLLFLWNLTPTIAYVAWI